MGSCVKCGAALAKTEEAAGVCYPCESRLSASEREQLLGVRSARSEIMAEAAREEAALATRMKKEMLMTTEAYPMGLEIRERLEIVTAECVFGMNVFRDFFAGVRDIVGGRSAATQKVFRDARKTVLSELRQEAFAAGGNAVIGVGIQYSQLPGNGGSMLMVVATGTAVVIGGVR